MTTQEAKSALNAAMGPDFIANAQNCYYRVYGWLESVDAGDRWPNWYWVELLKMKQETHPELFN
jgi:hypothetical protein